jgi:hypothetical protein
VHRAAHGVNAFGEKVFSALRRRENFSRALLCGRFFVSRRRALCLSGYEVDAPPV